MYTDSCRRYPPRSACARGPTVKYWDWFQKKEFYFIYSSTKTGHLQSTSLVPAHTFASGAVIVCNIHGLQLVGCLLRSVLQPSRCLLLIQNVVLSLPILLFEINVSRKVWYKVSKETVASSQCVWMSSTVLLRALHGLAHCRDEGSSFSPCLDEPAWPSFSVFPRISV